MPIRNRSLLSGLKLMDLVDRDDPRESLLFLMPTNREEHTGGERIKRGSREEKVLLNWINYLAGLNEEQIGSARDRIARAEQLKLKPLAVRRLTHSQYITAPCRIYWETVANLQANSPKKTSCGVSRIKPSHRGYHHCKRKHTQKAGRTACGQRFSTRYLPRSDALRTGFVRRFSLRRGICGAILDSRHFGGR